MTEINSTSNEESTPSTKILLKDLNDSQANIAYNIAYIH